MSSEAKSPTFGELHARLAGRIASVIRGKDEVIRDAVICMLSEGHLLIQDVPGLGKTTLARALAASTQVAMSRIQFTPDLLPSDVTGVAVFDPKTTEFEFRPGPIFHNIVLADEINRASPKTQSALREVMEEGTVTYDGFRYTLPKPFMVIATQNPIDMEGTYTLPEAQLDRFLMRISMDYPSVDAEIEILRSERDGATVTTTTPAVTETELLAMIDYVKKIQVEPILDRYIVDVVAATRTDPAARLGASPRASLALLRAARAAAACEGRPFVTPEDIKRLAFPVMAHRIIMRPEAEMSGQSANDVVQRALDAVPVPRRSEDS